MFKDCQSLSQIDLFSFDFNNVSFIGIFDIPSSQKVIILKEKYKNILSNDPCYPYYKEYISFKDKIRV